MLKTKLSIAIALAAALLLAPAAYAAEGTTTGSFGAASSTPEVTAVNIYDTTDPNCTGAPITDMTPQTTYYYAKVSVTSNSKLKQLETIRATLFYNASGNLTMPAPLAGDVHDCAILTCTIGAPPGYAISWSSDFGTSTTWTLHQPGCQSPASLDATSGDWIFAFEPGTVATENTGAAMWNVQGYAENRNDAKNDDLYVRDKNMMWYGEITVNDPAVDWGAVPLGLVFENATYNPETVTDVNYIANGDYAEDIKSSDNWTGAVTLDIVTLDVTGGNPPAADSQFALEANDTSDNVTAITVTNSYNSIDNTGTITEEAGDTVNTNTLWLSISAAGIVPDTYSGSIYYQISNR